MEGGEKQAENQADGRGLSRRRAIGLRNSVNCAHAVFRQTLFLFALAVVSSHSTIITLHNFSSPLLVSRPLPCSTPHS